MLTSFALGFVVAFQSGSVITDTNRYFLKADGLDPVPLGLSTSHPGLYNKITKPISFQCFWTAPLLKWLNRASKVKDAKLRLDRVSPNGRVIASFDLTGGHLSRLRLGDGITANRLPIITLTTPSADAVAKNADPQNTDQGAYTMAEVETLCHVNGKQGPADWGSVTTLGLICEGFPGNFTFKSGGILKIGKKVPEPQNMMVRINLKRSGKPTAVALFSLSNARLTRIEATQSLLVRSDSVIFGAAVPGA